MKVCRQAIPSYECMATFPFPIPPPFRPAAVPGLAAFAHAPSLGSAGRAFFNLLSVHEQHKPTTMPYSGARLPWEVAPIGRSA